MQAQEGHIFTLPSRILLATDLSDLKQILPVAIDYALKSKSALKLVHVLPDFNAPDSQPVLADGDTIRQHAEKTLEEAAAKVREAGLKCSWTVCNGQVDHTIMQIAQEWKADRVVVGTFGPQKLHQELLGSVAEAILREADVPVLAVGPTFRSDRKEPAKKIRVLLATALNRESIATTESVVRFAKSHRAELTMLHVIPEIAKGHPSALRVRAYAESKFHEILSGIPEEKPPYYLHGGKRPGSPGDSSGCKSGALRPNTPRWCLRIFLSQRHYAWNRLWCYLRCALSRACTQARALSKFKQTASGIADILAARGWENQSCFVT